MRILFTLFLFCLEISHLKAGIIDSSLFKTSFETLTEIGLPIVVVETENGEMPSFIEAVKQEPLEGKGGKGIIANYVKGKLSLFKNGVEVYSSGDYYENESGIKIKVRGNTSSVDHEKKPYKIKLEKKFDLLFRGNDKQYKDKNWVLIKDNNINAKIGFKINELIGMQWTPSYCYVNLILNDRYMGVYMLCESVRRNTNCRLNVSGNGYIIEYDAYWWNSKHYFESSFPLPMHYTFKYPDEDEVSNEQIKYIQEYVSNAEASLNTGLYSDYIDVKSFASWILAHDILGTWDAGGSNYFITKYDDTSNSKLEMANLWDFETNFRRNVEWSTTHLAGWFFYDGLFHNENTQFLEEYQRQWLQINPSVFDNIINYLQNYENSDEAYSLERSISLDNQLWGTEWKSVSQSITDAIDWFNNRKIWMTNAMNKLTLSSLIQKQEIRNEESQQKSYNLKGILQSKKNKGLIVEKGKKEIIK